MASCNMVQKDGFGKVDFSDIPEHMHERVYWYVQREVLAIGVSSKIHRGERLDHPEDIHSLRHYHDIWLMAAELFEKQLSASESEGVN